MGTDPGRAAGDHPSAAVRGHVDAEGRDGAAHPGEWCWKNHAPVVRRGSPSSRCSWPWGCSSWRWSRWRSSSRSRPARTRARGTRRPPRSWPSRRWSSCAGSRGASTCSACRSRDLTTNVGRVRGDRASARQRRGGAAVGLSPSPAGSAGHQHRRVRGLRGHQRLRARRRRDRARGHRLHPAVVDRAAADQPEQHGRSCRCSSRGGPIAGRSASADPVMRLPEEARLISVKTRKTT